MKKKIFQVSFFIFVSTIFGYGQSNSWKSLTPLISTRADVEKLLGKPQRSNYGSCFDYKTEKQGIFVCYSGKECDEGWNVTKDTILKITVYNSDAEKGFDDLKLGESKFSYTVDDALYSTWTNAGEGLQYYFDGYRTLQSTRFIPKKSDNHLRCNGFPPYAPEGQHFTMESFFFIILPLIKRKDYMTFIAV